jgi:hypothetical protein
MIPSHTYLVISDSFTMPEKQLSELNYTMDGKGKRKPPGYP